MRPHEASSGAVGLVFQREERGGGVWFYLVPQPVFEG